ncbi:MAG: excinuclease ABC subunit C [Ignavibacteria bacterium]|nr:excinuclease ABC subunit C [Ignavibacteria bacterium]
MNDKVNPARKVAANLKVKLSNLPSGPGIYQFKDATGKVIYVGKAKNIKKRVKQYFQAKEQYGRIAVMLSKISDIEIIQTDSEIEALILELNLIKKLKPRYNVNLKDDKTYPYIVITNEPFPRVFPTRTKRADGSRYFGPYTDVKTMRSALRAIRDIFMIRSCNLSLTEEAITAGKFKICLDYQIQKCKGPCEGLISRFEYANTINQVARILNGKSKSVVEELTKRMNSYSEKMFFEQAAQLRDKIRMIKIYASKQKMVSEDLTDRDVIAVEKEDNDGCGMVLKIRDGKVIGKSHFYLANVIEKPDGEILEIFLANYYSVTEFIPEEIIIPTKLENPDFIFKWLEKKQGITDSHGKTKLKLIAPKAGEKMKLLNMVRANARLMLEELKLAKMKREFTAPSLEALRRDLNLEKIPRRIECFDISHIQGTDTVASMIVFQDAKPRKNDYRKYKITTILNEAGEPDDFASMREVIYRRYRKSYEEEDEKSLPLPDLIVIDGGKGQLSSAVKVLTDIGITIKNPQPPRSPIANYQPLTTNHQPLTTKPSITVIALAKKLEEVYFPGEHLPHNIPKTSIGLKLLQKIRDEAHRFAVTFHRSLRDRRTLKTELTDIKGIGESTAKKLLSLFGSVNEIKKILTESPDELEKYIRKKTAAILKKHYLKEEQKRI